MTSKVTIVKSPPVAPELAPFGPPPLIEGEDSTAYDERLARVAVKPADILEDIWVRDFVDLDWEAPPRSAQTAQTRASVPAPKPCRAALAWPAMRFVMG